MTNQKSLLRIERAAVLGSGVMGSQIAAHLANAGLEVLLLDMPAKEGKRNALVDGAVKNLSRMKPSPVMTKNVLKRITTGNFEDDLSRIADADWVIEVVIEKLDIKRSLLGKVVPHLKESALLTTNTSGLPIAQIAEALPDTVKTRFFGTHFFNPPRYLKLFEVIPTPETDPELVAALSEFARVRLGKGVVEAKDTPNFIANRIGTYAMMVHLDAIGKGYSITEIDELTGTLTGRPKSATFRTADVVGLDTLMYVSENLFTAISDDPKRNRFKTPELLGKLVQNKRLGAKTRAGFYTKQKGEILSINPTTLEYEAAKKPDFDLTPFKKISSLSDRWKALFEDEGRVGNFIRPCTAEILWYAADRVPEISDNPEHVDNAIRWGFGWQMGPFEIMDAIGLDSLKKVWSEIGLTQPDWLTKLDQIYALDQNAVNAPSGVLECSVFADERSVADITKGKDLVWSNPEVALHDAGDGVLLLEFLSKANTLGKNVVEGIIHAVKTVEHGPYGGLLIANDGENFSVGANLGEMAGAVMSGDLKQVESAVALFQEMVQTVRYAQKPVVAAIQGKVLGGGCELSLACSHVVAAAETYIGLVELGVGLMPAGTGSMHFAWSATQKSPSSHASDIQKVLLKGFETIATAKVATSGFEAIELGYLNQGQTTVVMNASRRLSVAKAAILYLDASGYTPPSRRSRFLALGAPARAAMATAAYQMNQAGFATDYDRFLAEKLAFILTGGELTGAQEVDEDYFLKLERDVFVELLKEEKTQARVQSILTTNKPLRN